MNIDGKPYRTIWLNQDGKSVDIIDQTKLLASIRDRDAAHARRRGTRHLHHAGEGGALDRGDRSLWGGARLAPACELTKRSTMRARCSPPRVPRPSISAGRSMRCRRPCATSRATSASPRRMRAPPKSATRTWRPTARSASMGSASSARMPTRRMGLWSTSSPIAMPVGSLASIGAPRSRRSIARMTRASKSHVWVDETRPRNQGASLTAFELGAHGVPHTLIADNAGGHLMQKKLVDLCIVGTDRTTSTGDVANKIGTYLEGARRARQRRSVLTWRCRTRPSIGA